MGYFQSYDYIWLKLRYYKKLEPIIPHLFSVPPYPHPEVLLGTISFYKSLELKTVEVS